jgi:hypothetical protein
MERGAKDTTTILENLVQLDEMLDERSRQALGEVPYLELSKHLRIRRDGPAGDGLTLARGK